MIFLDTHVVIWLYQKEETKFSLKAINEIENNELIISPIVSLELEYLYEIQKINVTSKNIIDYLSEKIGLSISKTPLAEIVQTALNCKWTRDPFDRLIAAEAIFSQIPILTKDQSILQNCSLAIWD